jgi:hypothetical protein
VSVAPIWKPHFGCSLAEVANAIATWRGEQPFVEVEARGYFDCADNA